MKKLNLILIALSVVTLNSCSSSKNMSRTGESYDDVYYSSEDDFAKRDEGASYGNGDREVSNGSENYGYNEVPDASTSRLDDNGNTYVTNNYYNKDDYYDYAYASRLRRFHTSVSIGFGYYDGWFTNSYWYNYNPTCYGVSIYTSYSWWTPTYYTPYYNYSYNPCGNNYNPWGNPYSCGGGYNTAYVAGYNQGYYNGYNSNFYNNPYYFNSYDCNSYYYGPRGNTAGGGGSGSNTYNAYGTGSGSLNHVYQTHVIADRGERPAISTQISSPRPRNASTETQGAGFSSDPRPMNSGKSNVKNNTSTVGGTSGRPSKVNQTKGSHYSSDPRTTTPKGSSSGSYQSTPRPKTSSPSKGGGNSNYQAPPKSTSPSKGGNNSNYQAPPRSTSPSKGGKPSYQSTPRNTAPKTQPVQSKPRSSAPKNQSGYGYSQSKPRPAKSGGSTYQSSKGNYQSKPRTNGSSGAKSKNYSRPSHGSSKSSGSIKSRGSNMVSKSMNRSGGNNRSGSSRSSKVNSPRR